MLRTLSIGLVGAAAGAAAGFLLGATVGGNFMSDVAMAGSRGYEATAPIGAIAGGVAGALLGPLVASRRSRTRGHAV